MSRPWFVEAFESDYLDVYRHRGDGAAVAEAEWALGALEINERSRIVDVGCGTGRHAAAISAHGHRVLGLDLSRDLLQRARARCCDALFVRADMRRIPVRRATVDAVVSFFTSFGYFDDDAENRSVLREMARIMKPGARLLIDFLNARYVQDNLVAESVRRIDDIEIHERRWTTPDDRRVEKEVTIFRPGSSTRRWRESVRLFSPVELEEMLCNAGVEVEHRFGSLDGVALTPDAERCVLVGRRLRS